MQPRTARRATPPGLQQAADAAGGTRDGWLHVAHALDRVTTDTSLHLSSEAAESADLALWTGQLAYTAPAWTLTSGPAHQARPPDSLVPAPGDLPLAVAAVHHACDTLTSLAGAHTGCGRGTADPGPHAIPA